MDVMQIQTSMKPGKTIFLIVVFLMISACSRDQTPTIVYPPTVAIQVPTNTEVSETAEVITLTEIPAAAIVNGELISLEFFEGEVARYLAAQDANAEASLDETQAREVVLNDLIDQVLLAQAARAGGLNISDEEVQEKIASLSEDVNLVDWMNTWGYNEESLFETLKLQMLAALQRDLIIKAVPDVMEQAELRQVFAYTQEGARSALTSLRSGVDFEDVAYTYDPVTGGYLGWVPRGYLLIPAVEDAAFSLPVGSYSDVIESNVGYHIVLVIAREDRTVSGDALLTLQRQALYDWLEVQRGNSAIEVLDN
jgi:parvulin-like peptidyl-prolyl isomerase